MNEVFQRLRRIFRQIDARTIVGIVLVVGSAVGVGVILNSAGAGVDVVVMTRYVPQGAVVTAADIDVLTIAHSRHGDYVMTDAAVGRRAAFDIGPGEIVTRRMFEPLVSTDETLLIPLSESPGSRVEPGTVVSVWSLPADVTGVPVQVASRAVVVDVPVAGLTPDSALEIRVPRRDVAAILAAIGNAGGLLVSVPGSP